MVYSVIWTYADIKWHATSEFLSDSKKNWIMVISVKIDKLLMHTSWWWVLLVKFVNEHVSQIKVAFHVVY